MTEGEAVGCSQGERGLQGRPGPSGPAQTGEPGLPVSLYVPAVGSFRSWTVRISLSLSYSNRRHKSNRDLGF